jgi:hypothetical protein
MTDLGTNLDRHGRSDEAVVKAKWYLYRTGNRDLWEILGLVDDPVATAARTAKAYRDMSGGHGHVPAARTGYCPTCQNWMNGRTSACRRTMACRKAAEEAS